MNLFFLVDQTPVQDFKAVTGCTIITEPKKFKYENLSKTLTIR